jgi:putative restriction endonuclease
LSARHEIGEVNFWRPSGDSEFRALTPGEPFFFKTHYPQNRIVGGGFYSGYARLRLSEAWDTFGEANGAASLADMRRLIERYRRGSPNASDDPVIGSVFVRDVVFFADEDVAPAPPDFAKNVVRGKTYDLASTDYARFFDLLIIQLLGVQVEVDLRDSWHRPGPAYGDPRLMPQRLGQRAFQAVVLDAYHRRCSITGDKIRPVLQAAHIRPLSRNGEHRLDNGLLLRSDVHTLFDSGYLSVDPEYRLRVSPRLRREFENGEEFYARDGQSILVPDRRADRPNRHYLEWHTDEVFLSA